MRRTIKCTHRATSALSNFMTSRRNTIALAIWLFFVVAHANPTEAALLTTIVGWDNSPVFSDPPSGFEYCGKVTTVFGVAMCVTANAWAAGEAKSSHVANVFYQLLDNDADGCVDDAAILDKMITGNYLLLLSDGSESVSDDSITASGVKQYGDLGTSEVYVNSCDVPSNRGAINTDRTTCRQRRSHRQNLRNQSRRHDGGGPSPHHRSRTRALPGQMGQHFFIDGRRRVIYRER